MDSQIEKQLEKYQEIDLGTFAKMKGEFENNYEVDLNNLKIIEDNLEIVGMIGSKLTDKEIEMNHKIGAQQEQLESLEVCFLSLLLFNQKFKSKLNTKQLNPPSIISHQLENSKKTISLGKNTFVLFLILFLYFALKRITGRRTSRYQRRN